VAQNIDVAIAAPDFHVAMLGAVPLVDIVDHFDHPAVETKLPEPFGTAFVHIGFDLDLPGALAVATMSGLVHRGAWPESAGPAPPARRTGVSPGVLGQNGYGSLRHASSVDWFIA